MLVGVLADTHFSSLQTGVGLLERLRRSLFSQVEMILHAGDVGLCEVLDGYLDVPVLAVQGNTDPPASGLPLKRVLELEGFRIGLIHGWGSPVGLEERVLSMFEGDHLHCLVYGHSHRPACHHRAGTLLFNPGSPTEPRSTRRTTVGLLHLGASITGQVLSFDSMTQGLP